MKRARVTTAVLVLGMAAFSTALVGAIGPDGQAPGTAGVKTARVARGAYLVQIMGCNDCHTPMKMGPAGPERDMTRALTGHPEAVAMPPAPQAAGPWAWGGAATSTAFWGPWGVSFAANLTPDQETGLGAWTEEMFIATMKTGRHQGKGRLVLPPMPVQILAAASEEDIKSIFAYLQSLAPVKNKVPTPVDPAAEEKR